MSPVSSSLNPPSNVVEVTAPISSDAMPERRKKGKGLWKKEELKPSDPFLSDPQIADLVLPIMGPLGVGKSTFINKFLGEDVAGVRRDSEYKTVQVQHFLTYLPLDHPQYPGRRLVLLDVPGFYDPVEGTYETLRRIAVWLAQSYDADMILVGVVYLHEMFKRPTEDSLKTLDVVHKLCGPDATKNMIVAMTKWDVGREDVGKQHEARLKDEHLGEMMRQGARVDRFDATSSSAQRIVNSILERPPVEVFQIQKELVEMDKFLPDTKAGRILRFNLELLKRNKQRIAPMQTGFRHQQSYSSNQDVVRQIKLFDVPWSKRVKRFCGF